MSTTQRLWAKSNRLSFIWARALRNRGQKVNKARREEIRDIILLILQKYGDAGILERDEKL